MPRRAAPKLVAADAPKAPAPISPAAIPSDIQPGYGLRRGEAAIFAAEEAARLDTNPRVEVGDDILFATEARRCWEEAEALHQQLLLCRP